MTIHWDDAAIPWRNIDSTTNNVFALSQYNAQFNSEKRLMKCILNDKDRKSDLKAIAEVALIFILNKETIYTHY